MERLIEEDIYSEEGIEQFKDDDCISNEENGFMIGYLCAM